MVILESEDGIKTVAVYADIVVTQVPQETVCHVTFKVFALTSLFYQRTPLMDIVT